MTLSGHNVTITFNGEIYNYRSLKRELLEKGAIFRSETDTEVILWGYVLFGDLFIKRLQGMFALVIWDGRTRTALLVRDGIGQKPLFWTRGSKGGIFFASTPEALFCLLEERPSVDPVSLSLILTSGYLIGKRSLWKNIHSLEPGYAVKFSESGAVSSFCHFDAVNLQPDESFRSSDEAEFLDLLTLVCEEHRISDVPLRLLVSGGLDSSLLAYIFSKSGRADVDALTLNFEGYSRGHSAVDLCNSLGINLETHVMTPETNDSARHGVAKCLSQPQGYSSHRSWYKVCQAAKERCDVVISGDGADELFGGYAWYGSNTRVKLAKDLIKSMLYPLDKEYFEFGSRSSIHRHLISQYPRFLPYEAAQLTGLSSSEFNEETVIAEFEPYFRADLPRQDAFQRLDLLTFCSGHICRKTDEMGMAHSLEVRAPFLDKRVIEWSLSRRAQTWVKRSKPFLRQILKKKVPESIVRAPKQGFSVPIRQSSSTGTMDASRFSASLFDSKAFNLVKKKSRRKSARLDLLKSVMLWLEVHEYQ